MRRARRGFTLMEVVTVVAIVGIITAMAVPSFTEISRRSHVNASTRRMVGTLRESRSMAIARRTVNGQRAEAAGIRIDSDTRYSQFLDPDSDATNGNELVLRTVDLSGGERSPALRISQPAVGSMVRFRRDGGTAATTIVLTDTETGRTRNITLTAGGQSSLE